MSKNRWLLGTVAFIVSFALSLLVFRDIKTAFGASSIGVLATFCGAIAVNCKQAIQRRRIVTALDLEIRKMEKWRWQVYDSLLGMVSEQHRTQNHVNFLKRQIDRLYLQSTEQQIYKQQLSHEITDLEKQKRLMEAEAQHWETQVYHLEQQKEELDLSLRSLLSEKHNLEAELQQLQLQTSPIATDTNSSEKLPDEWIEFVAQLTNSELQVLKAIAHLENPNAEIKKIAESYITMPELLIDAINERAIATIGDIIIERGSLFPVIAETEYLTNIKEVLEIK